MRYFDRTNKFSNILLVSSAIFFVLVIIYLFRGSVVDQVFEFSNGNYVRSGVIFAIYFLLFVFTLITGIALKCVVKDAKEELDTIKRDYNNKLK